MFLIFQRCLSFSAAARWLCEMSPRCQGWFCSAGWIIDVPGAGLCCCEHAQKDGWLKVCHMLLICASSLCSATLGHPVYLAGFLVCEKQALSFFPDSLGNVCGFFNVVILQNNFKCSSYVCIICVYLLKGKKKSSNSFQKGKEIGRNTFKLKYYFPKGLS